MTVKDYAEEMQITVAEVLNLCNKFNISVSEKEDVLSDEDIITLDNAAFISEDSDNSTFSDEEHYDEFDHDIKSPQEKETKKQVPLKSVDASLFQEKKKKLYKSKEKLQKNKADETVLIYKSGITLYEIGEQMRVNPAELIKKLLTLDLTINIKDEVSFEVAEMLASEYSIRITTEESNNIANFEDYVISDKDKDLIKRAPIVTIMGHVDHGKTSLLDYIRKSGLTQAEAGGITQTIGAYQVKKEENEITFIDTPGHEAFTEMRARGASVTDIIIIIVAADDGVMPQTKEAVEHALNANVPIIVVINKIDKTTANVEKIMQSLSELKLMPEEWGGDIPFIKVSAITGEGIDLLLDTILTIAEVNEYKANPKRYALGTVIESKMDKKVGGVCSLLIQNGTLRVGDPIVVGTCFAKVRSMKNDRGEQTLEASPSTPVEVTGINGTPLAGDKFMAFETDSEAKKIASERKLCLEKKQCKSPINFEELFASIQEGRKELNVILKADVKGCEEAIKASLAKINIKGITVNVVRSDIGAISESDIDLAIASDSVVIGFNSPASGLAVERAQENKIEIKNYDVIYKLIEDIEKAMLGMLDPVYKEKQLGKAEVKKIFTFSKVGKIAGSLITEGILKSGEKVRIFRSDKLIGEAKISSIQREKDTVKEIKKGFECGITLEDFNDLEVGDILECFTLEEGSHEL